MESIVAMSLLSGKTRFERSCLPAMAQLDLHVDGADFQALVQRIELDGALIEKLARLIHNEFCRRLRDEGLLTVAKFIYLLYTILIFFDPLTFSRLFERNRPKKEERMLSSPRLDHCLSVIERKE